MENYTIVNNIQLLDDAGSDTIYGDRLPEMRTALGTMLSLISELRCRLSDELGSDPVDHCLARIKTDRSMRDKCRRRKLPVTAESALTVIRDAIGIRIVCSFLDDVYRMREAILDISGIELLEEKDYIRHAKPNGYRSLHMIVRVNGGCSIELQLRTISMDTWAALEHQIHYKKAGNPADSLIARELKRCADELASTDITMQAIRDMLRSET